MDDYKVDAKVKVSVTFSPEDIIEELIDCVRLALDLSQSDALVSETTRKSRILLSAALVEAEVAARQFVRSRPQSDIFAPLNL